MKCPWQSPNNHVIASTRASQVSDFNLLATAVCLFFHVTSPVSRLGAELAKAAKPHHPQPPPSEEGSPESPSLDKEGSGVVEPSTPQLLDFLTSSFVFIDIPGSFVDFSTSQAPFHAKAAKRATPNASSSEEPSSEFPSLDKVGSSTLQPVDLATF